MDGGGTSTDDVQSCLVPMDDFSQDPSPAAAEEHETDFTRLTSEENEEMRDFLDSAARLSVDKFDLREGFYSDSQPSASWHCLSEDDITAHHRMGVFPHTWQPLSSMDPLIERHRSSHRSSPRHAENSLLTPSAHSKSETTGEKVTDTQRSHPTLDKSRSCDVVLDESSPFSPAADFINMSPVSDSAVMPDALADSRQKLEELDNDKSVCLDDDEEGFSVCTPLICDASRGQLPLICDNQTALLSTGDLLSKPAAACVDVGSPRILRTENGPGESEAARPKVSFILGADPDEERQEELPKVNRLSDRSDGTMRHSKSRRSSAHGRQRHRLPVLELYSRRRLGSEVSFGNTLKPDVPTEIDEAMTLEGVHLQEMASHRFDDSKAMRRRKISHHTASVVHIGHMKKVKAAPVVPRRLQSEQQLQHHKMFVELDELCVGENKEWAWHEKARWIKFEEEVEETAQRWGKPHVSSLSFHSLLELRRRIESAAILLDLDAVDLPSIATNIVEQLVHSGQLCPDVQGHVLHALLLKHRLLLSSSVSAGCQSTSCSGDPGQFHNCQSSAPNFKESSDTSPNLFLMSKAASMSTPAGASLVESPRTDEAKQKQLPKQGSHVRFKEPSLDAKIKSNPSVRSFLAVLSPKPADSPAAGLRHAESHILKRIPDGAETTSVLVGTVDFLDHPVMAFVRLSKACHLENLTEVPLPVRFIFVLMGPESAGLNYHEIGRSVSTLMADPTFHDMAYVVESQQDLLDALNTFLHESIVLPPGEWDKKTLLPIMDRTRQKVLKKRTKRDEHKAAEKQEKHDDPLKRTGRFFGGLVNDVKRRYPVYLSDIKDGLNVQCVAAFFFVYFACLSPAITFGGLLGDKTDKWMGVSEMLVSTAICGVVFALLSGQPLIIIGATGPVLVFEEALYKMCNSFGIEFLPFRFWVSLWITIIAVIVVMVEGSFLVQYITRFTEEIFASLISLIFIYEVFKKLILIFKKNPLREYYLPPCRNSIDVSLTDNDTNALTVADLRTDSIWDSMMEISTSLPYNNYTSEQNFTSSCDDSYGHPNTAFLSMILTFGTFLIAHYLKNFRNSQFLGRSARRAIGDFGVPMTIIVMVLVDYLIPETYTEKLDVPDGVQPTAPYKRGWFVNPLGLKVNLPAWTMFAAIIPALLVFILLFMEAQITSMIVNKKDRKLKKGSGYHVDLFLIGILSTVCGSLGLPFMCSATVRSVTHVSALSVFSRTHAPGEKPQLLEVKEQRLTSLAVHLMVGVSVLLGPVLRQVPLAVLFGIFLYMGIASMSGIQMLHRVQLMFMPVKHHPDVGYARRVRLAKMNLYTIIQLGCLGLLWAIKSTQAALAFPFVLILMVPVRLHILRFLFTKQELEELDRDEECASDNEEDEPDFYTQAHMPI